MTYSRNKLIPAIFDRSSFDKANFGSLLDNSVGFDTMFNRLFEDFLPAANSTTYPPYNIRHDDEHTRTIEVALAGYSDADLDITVEAGNVLVIKGNKVTNIDDAENKYLYRGVAARKFERRFQLADGVEVTDATLKDGMLNVSITVAAPELEEPKRIAINGTDSDPTET